MAKAMRLFLRGAASAMLAFSLLGVPSALAHPGDGGQHVLAEAAVQQLDVAPDPGLDAAARVDELEREVVGTGACAPALLLRAPGTHHLPLEGVGVLAADRLLALLAALDGLARYEQAPTPTWVRQNSLAASN